MTAEGAALITRFETEFNDLLVKAYGSVERLEEQMLNSAAGLHVSIREIHLMQAVYNAGESCTISRLSLSQGVSLPSVTAAVNKLCQKGYVEKRKSPADRRVVHVVLTKLGAKAVKAHRYFHTRMVQSVTRTLTGEEQQTMLKGVRKLNQFFNEKLHREEGTS